MEKTSFRYTNYLLLNQIGIKNVPFLQINEILRNQNIYLILTLGEL